METAVVKTKKEKKGLKKIGVAAVLFGFKIILTLSKVIVVVVKFVLI